MTPEYIAISSAMNAARIASTSATGDTTHTIGEFLFSIAAAIVLLFVLFVVCSLIDSAIRNIGWWCWYWLKRRRKK